MKINLNSNNILTIQDQVKKLVTFLIRTNNQNGEGYNVLIAPMGVINLLMDSPLFLPSSITDPEHDIKFLVGRLGEHFIIYGDLLLQRNHIILTKEISSVRDHKIDMILDEDVKPFVELVIEVECDFI